MNELSYRDEGSGLNFGLQPASNQTYEIGAKYSGWLGGLASVAAFRINTDNEIVVKSSSNGRTVYQNAGKTRRPRHRIGLERRNRPRSQCHAGLHLADARYKSDSANLANNKRIPGIAEHAAYLGADYAPEQGWQAGAGVRALSKVYVNDANSEAAPGFLTADIHAGYVWRLARRLAYPRSYAALNNLFNRQYIGSVIVNDGNGRYFEPRTWSQLAGRLEREKKRFDFKERPSESFQTALLYCAICVNKPQTARPVKLLRRCALVRQGVHLRQHIGEIHLRRVLLRAVESFTQRRIGVAGERIGGGQPAASQCDGAQRAGHLLQIGVGSGGGQCGLLAHLRHNIGHALLGRGNGLQQRGSQIGRGSGQCLRNFFALGEQGQRHGAAVGCGFAAD